MTIIQKYQSGGEALPFVDYMPFEGLGGADQATVPKASNSKNSDDDLGIKDLLKLVGEMDGLPSDTTKIVATLKNLYSGADLFSSGSISTDTLVSTYLSALQQLKVAGFNKEEYNDAKEEVIKNGGLHEFAIDERGRVLVQNPNDGSIQRISVKDYFDNRDEYMPLTNSNLLYYRANSKDFSFDNRVLDVVSNGIGEQKITEMIQRALNGVGSGSIEKQGYTQKQAKNIEGGLELLKQAHDEGLFNDPNDLMPIDSLHKMGLTTKDQQAQINMALNYLMRAMPENAKSWLMLKGGDTENPSKGAMSMLANLMYAHNTYEKKFEISPIKNPNIKEKDSLANSDKSTPYTLMQRGQGGTEGSFELNQGTNNSMMVDGIVYAGLQDQDWNIVGATSMSNLMNAGYAGITRDMKGISFGDRVIDVEDLDNLYYNGSGGIVVSLPYKIVNSTKVVDLNVLTEYNKAYEEYKKLPKEEQTQPNLAKLLQEHGLLDLVDQTTGLPNQQRFSNFLVVTAYGVDKDKKFYKNNNGDDNIFVEDQVNLSDSLKEQIERGLSTEKADDKNKRNYKIDTESWFESSNPDTSWFSYDHVYKGSVYIPLSENELQGLNASKMETQTDVATKREYQYQLMQKRKNAQTASADLLN